MIEFLKKRKRLINILLIIGICSLTVCCLLWTNKDLRIYTPLICMISLISFGTCIYYTALPHKSFKWLKRIGRFSVIDDIPMDQPTFRLLGIYCGKEAFLHKKSMTVIPYDQILWINMYVDEQYISVDSNITTKHTTISIHTRTHHGFFFIVGGKNLLSKYQQEYDELLKTYILPRYPDVGNGQEIPMMDFLKKADPVYMAQVRMKDIRFWRRFGIGLMVSGALLITLRLIVLLCNGDWDGVTSAVIISAFLLTGGAFMHFHAKKKSGNLSS